MSPMIMIVGIVSPPFAYAFDNAHRRLNSSSKVVAWSGFESELPAELLPKENEIEIAHSCRPWGARVPFCLRKGNEQLGNVGIGLFRGRKAASEFSSGGHGVTSESPDAPRPRAATLTIFVTWVLILHLLCIPMFARKDLPHISMITGRLKSLRSLHILNKTPSTMPHITQSPLSVPAGSFDTHVHVFDPSLGPYAKSRAYTPADAPMEDLIRFSSTWNSSSNPLNLVLVQPSPYDTDNRVLLQSLHKLNTNFTISARGIAVVNVLDVTRDELMQMHQAGVRGLRINLQSDGKGVDLDKLKQTLLVAAEKIKNLAGWRLQIFAPAATWDGKSFTLEVEL